MGPCPRGRLALLAQFSLRYPIVAEIEPLHLCIETLDVPVVSAQRGTGRLSLDVRKARTLEHKGREVVIGPSADLHSLRKNKILGRII